MSMYKLAGTGDSSGSGRSRVGEAVNGAVIGGAAGAVAVPGSLSLTLAADSLGLSRIDGGNPAEMRKLLERARDVWKSIPRKVLVSNAALGAMVGVPAGALAGVAGDVLRRHERLHREGMNKLSSLSENLGKAWEWYRKGMTFNGLEGAFDEKAVRKALMDERGLKPFFEEKSSMRKHMLDAYGGDGRQLGRDLRVERDGLDFDPLHGNPHKRLREARAKSEAGVASDRKAYEDAVSRVDDDVRDRMTSFSKERDKAVMRTLGAYGLTGAAVAPAAIMAARRVAGSGEK